ncbi:MAG: peptidoglycan DD-metalloendopeptidase family protein, partial [Burkholderiales bacterium]
MTRSAIRLFAVALVGALLAGASFAVRRTTDARLASAERVAVSDSAAAAQITRQHHDVLTTTKVRFGDNFGDVLRSQQLAPATVSQITSATLRVFKLRNLRAGQQVDFVRRWDGALKSVLLHSGWDQAITITRMPDGFVAAATTLPSSSKLSVVQGRIASSLFESVLEAGEHPELAVRLAEIFAWDLDFYTDPRPGDTFRLVFEKRTVKGSENPTYGRIYAAEYVNGDRKFDAVLFHDPDGKPAYYSADGKSLQKAFLRSPLKFAARISSHFSRSRFHPVLKVYRAHLGTDYAAPVGTPVQAIANGRVEFSGRKGGDGNMVVLRHSNGFESYYLHLAQRMVRVGQSVQQGQRIGLIGATGLATGPHLDFRLCRNGTFVDFERM